MRAAVLHVAGERAVYNDRGRVCAELGEDVNEPIDTSPWLTRRAQGRAALINIVVSRGWLTFASWLVDEHDANLEGLEVQVRWVAKETRARLRQMQADA